MEPLSKEELDRLNKAILPFENGLKDRNILNLRNDDELMKTELETSRSFLIRYIEGCEKNKHISELQQIHKMVTEQEVPEKYREQFKYPRYSDVDVETFLILEFKRQDVEADRKKFEDQKKQFGDFCMSSEGQFFFHCLNFTDVKLFYRLEEHLNAAEERCAEALKSVNGVYETLLNKIYDKADAQLEKIRNWFDEHDGAFQSMDLKLHDAFFVDVKNEFPAVAEYYDEDESSAFYSFCESTYDQFTEWMAEEKIDWNKMQKHVGRTSSFYLHDEGDGVVLSRHDYSIDFESSISNLFYELGDPYDDIKLTNEGKLDRDQNFQDNIENLMYLASGSFAEDIEKRYEDMLKVYDYIKDTKEHQVEYFKDWLSEEQNYIMDDKETEQPEQ